VDYVGVSTLWSLSNIENLIITSQSLIDSILNAQFGLNRFLSSPVLCGKKNNLNIQQQVFAGGHPPNY
jgi:hypothetical protein